MFSKIMILEYYFICGKIISSHKVLGF